MSTSGGARGFVHLDAHAAGALAQQRFHGAVGYPPAADHDRGVGQHGLDVVQAVAGEDQGQALFSQAPDQLEERLVMIEQRLMNAELSANRVMDRAFRLAMMLVVVLIVGLLLVVGLGAWVRSRTQRTPAA